MRKGPAEAFTDIATASSFRILRANLEPQLREGNVDVIVVTSPSPADGKTTVTTLLGEALGRLGMRVLLIDADLRRPGFARVIGVAPRPGLAEVLRGETSVLAAAQSGWSENVSVLATAHDPEAGDLLARRFTDVIDEAKESFDLILVDTPPLLSTDDARTMATMAKGILLVVSRGTLQRAMTEAVIAIEALQAPLMGIVANRFKESSVPYYYYPGRQQLLVERGERGGRRRAGREISRHRSRAARPSAAARAGSRSRSSIACASAAASSGGTTAPASPPSASCAPPTSLATTLRPLAIASSIPIDMPSQREGKATTSAAASQSATSARLPDEDARAALRCSAATPRRDRPRRARAAPPGMPARIAGQASSRMS